MYRLNIVIFLPTKRLNKTSTTNSVKKDIDEIETINIELEHRVAKLIAENEHLKQNYKQLYDSIKPSRVRAEEHDESLVNQLNQKSVEITDLNAQLQEKGVTWSTNSRSFMFDARHELCFLEFISDMNASSKSKSVKKTKKKEEWKPTGKVFTKIGYQWTPTGRTFNLVRNVCPLTRITTTNKGPLRESITLEVIAQESIVTKVYTRRPKIAKTNGSNSKPKIAKSVISNKTEPDTSRGSNTSVAPSHSSSVDLRISGTQSFSVVNKGYDGVFSNLSLFQSLIDQILYKWEKYILVIVDDYSRFTWVKFLASNDEAPNFVIKFLKMIQVSLNTPVRNIRIDNGTEFVNQTLRTYYESAGISHETSVARSPQQNSIVERRNHTLVEAARTMLIYTKAPLFLWVGAVAAACYTQSQSIIRRRHGKTPYELLHDRKPDLSYLYVFGALCYLNNDSKDLGKLQAKADIDIFIGYAPKKKAYRIYNRLPVTDAPRAVDLADSPVSTLINQNAPSISIPSKQDQEHYPIISQGFKESPKTPHFHDDPLHESLHEDSTSQGSSSNVRPIHTPFESLGRWTKDHPIANMIDDSSCSVSTIKKLQTDAMWCYFDAFLTSVKPKTTNKQ
ncbi:retrovirus-related pol polyprotein from transposon TNT 1-94 [Tanacetum coccineum]|uniref:Retrovirus-related pol polyprotein from transposon TNT 1-94 n=1 Tax=Tanacetum coccineum TaxID=301880 RepID=A0ABQ5DUN0_9ASTR